MAGHGPPPKDPSARARQNAEPIPTREIRFQPGKQPALPSRMPGGFAWPPRTRAWWKMWAESALAETFTANDWSELLDTAVLHGEFWSGDSKVAGELRLRVAKFGATPEDRARLRIIFVEADTKESAPSAPDRSRARYSGLRVVDGATASGQ